MFAIFAQLNNCKDELIIKIVDDLYPFDRLNKYFLVLKHSRFIYTWTLFHTSPSGVSPVWNPGQMHSYSDSNVYQMTYLIGLDTFQSESH